MANVSNDPKAEAASLRSDAELALDLTRRGGPATLATLRSDGGPFASYVVTAPAGDGSPLMLLSRLAVHTRNLLADPRASLLFVREPEAGAGAMAAERLTLTGRAMQDDEPGSAALYRARHPDSVRYAGFTDFALYRFHTESGHLVAGFGRIVTLSSRQIFSPAAGS